MGTFADIQERMLDEVRYQTRIGAVGEDRGGPAARRGFFVLRQRRFAQRVVGAFLRRGIHIGITACPRLDTGIDIHRAAFLAQLDQGKR